MLFLNLTYVIFRIITQVRFKVNSSFLKIDILTVNLYNIFITVVRFNIWRDGI